MNWRRPAGSGRGRLDFCVHGDVLVEIAGGLVLGIGVLEGRRREVTGGHLTFGGRTRQLTRSCFVLFCFVLFGLLLEEILRRWVVGGKLTP